MLREIAVWLIAVEACGVVALPLALRLFRRLPDSGYGFAKPLGLVLVAYLVWLPSTLQYLEYRRSTAALVLLLLGSVCWSWRGPEALAWLRERRSLVVLEEALFLAAGLLGVSIRAFNADIIGQEKLMDLAFFNGFVAATHLPAEDTWLAGYGMPYYPFGYLLLSVPTKLAGLPATFGYNLALVLVFALTFALSASLVANLVTLLDPSADAARFGPRARAWSFGLLGAAMVALFGNLVGPLEIVAARGLGGPAFWQAIGVKNLGPAASPSGWLPSDGGWWWHASRVIPTIQPDGITEFPYFSFLLGDLHPHFIALPPLLLIVGLSLALLLEAQPWSDPWLVLVAAVTLGVPLVANTWDVATFWTLYAAVALLVAWRLVRSGERTALRPFVLTLLPLPLGLALFSPYFVGYASQRLGLGFVFEGGKLRTDSTPLISLLIIFGPLLMLAVLLVWRMGRGTVQGASIRRRMVAIGGVLVIGLAILGLWAAALSLGLFTLVLSAARGRLRAWVGGEIGPLQAATLFLLGLGGLALGILVAVELVYIRDSFGTRMNTVFKFYYHVWLLLALLGAPALALGWSRFVCGSPGPVARGATGLLAAGFVALGLVYPLAATWTKSNGFRGQPTLDGGAFLERSRPGDAAAIRWLAERPSRPIVLEAVGGDYQEFGRVSSFSGLPTVLGWIGHELQWRGQLDEYGRRERDVEAVYRRAERDEALQLLSRYRVDYVFVGSLEREKYGRQADDRLGQWLTPVFRREGATIYSVSRQGTSP